MEPLSTQRSGARAEPEAMPSGNTAQDTPTHIRLGLQRRAPATLRRHVVRAARRFVVLLVADLASFWVMRELLRSVRDYALLGSTVADQLQALFPRGILSGWQFAAALVVGLLVTGTYGRGDMRRDPRRLFLAAALATALPLWMTIWGRGLEPVVVQYTLTTVLVWGGLVAERLLLDRLVSAVYPPANHAFPTLFVGPAEQCRAAMATTAFTNRAEFRPVGFVDVHVPPTADARGHITDFPGILHESGAETVVVCGYLTDERFQDVVESSLAAGCQLLSVPRAIDLAGVQPTLVWRRGQPLIELTAPSLKGRQLIVKRIVDMVGAATVLLLASPLMLLVAAAVKLDSRGPVLFGQERLGIGGRRFRVLKFRTMTHGASDAAHRALIAQLFNGDHDAAAHPGKNGDKVYKLVNDDRVTRIGALLRRTSLDELPQLFNVLRGDMSLVGPRPPLSYEFDAYDHWQYDRHRVKPGITGLWQVSGRNLLTYRQMCELDVRYVREWSLWLDVKILFRTIPVVFANSGRAA